MAVDTDTTTVDARSRLRQVPVQELVLPIVIVALIIVGMIIRPRRLPDQRQPAQRAHPGQHHRHHRHRHDVRDRYWRHRPVGRVRAGGGQHRRRAIDAIRLMDVHVRRLAMALLIGAINGAAIVWGKVVPFIATLAMLTLLGAWLCGWPRGRPSA